MDAGSDHVPRRDARAGEGRRDRVSVGIGQDIGGACGTRELVGTRALQREELGGQGMRERQLRGAEGSQRRPLSGAKSATTASTPSRLVPDITPA